MFKKNCLYSTSENKSPRKKMVVATAKLNPREIHKILRLIRPTVKFSPFKVYTYILCCIFCCPNQNKK